MATIPVGQGSFMRPYRRGRTRSFPEGPSQSFIVGDVLVLNATADKGNQVVKAGADPTTIVGVALQKASGVEGTLISVAVADDEAEFIAHVGDGQTLDNDDVGDAFGIVEDTTNKVWRVDRADTSNTCVRVLELLDKAGDVNGRVVVKFLSSDRAVYKSD